MLMDHGFTHEPDGLVFGLGIVGFLFVLDLALMWLSSRNRR